MISIEIVVQLGIVFTEWSGISGGTNTVIYIKFKNCIISPLRPALVYKPYKQQGYS